MTRRDGRERRVEGGRVTGVVLPFNPARFRRAAPRESTLETWFVRQCEKAGLDALKFAPPGRRGYPDRIVLAGRGGRLAFVELKRLGGKLRMLQIARRDELVARGFQVFADVDTKDKARAVINLVENWR